MLDAARASRVFAMKPRAAHARTLAFATLALALGALAHCKPERPGELPVRARASVLPGEGTPRVRIEVETAPHARINASNLTIANDRVPENSPMLFGYDLRADAQGRWSGEVELSPRAGAEQVFSIAVEAEVPSKRPFSHEMLRSLGHTTLTVPVPFRLRTDPERHDARASGPSLFYARLDRDCANFTLNGLPEGATVRMNGAEARATAGAATLPFARLAHLSALTVGPRTSARLPYGAQAPIDVAFEVRLADGSVQRASQRVTEALQNCARMYLVTSALAGRGAPMEPEGDGSLKLVYATGFGHSEADLTSVLGPPGPLANVRVVVVSTAERRPFGCGTYVSNSGRTMGSSAERETLHLTAYDRRTGATLGRTTLVAPPPRCFTTISASGGNGLSSVSLEEVERWVSRL